jgi:hypothetical protein
MQADEVKKYEGGARRAAGAEATQLDAVNN